MDRSILRARNECVLFIAGLSDFSDMEQTRRRCLAGIGAAAMAGLAGCSSLPVFGDGTDRDRRGWLTPWTVCSS